ncbi:MAG: general secretion pathway protein GspK [Planctomycetes bacterium]|nr:general secretion pathway protein GspK [Planctomycetota bacterium]
MFMKYHTRHAGMALILVFVVLTGLFVIAVPFLRSMLQARVTALSHSSSVMAQNDIISLRNLAYQHLVNAQIVNQQYQAESGDVSYIYSALMMQQVPLNTPEYTTQGEFLIQPNLSRMLDSSGNIRDEPAPMLDVVNAHERLWTVKIEDEQGKIDLNTASYFVIGNLIGATSLTQDMNDLDSASLNVRDASWFPPFNGFLLLGQELIGYSKVSSDCRIFYELSRATANSSVPGAGLGEFATAASNHLAEFSVVYPGNAYKIATTKFDKAQNPSNLYSFPTVESIREISTYNKFNNSYSDAIDAYLYDKIENSLTVHGSGDYPGTFFAPQILLNNLPQAQIDSNGTVTYNPRQVLTLSGNQAINIGSVLKITSDTGEVQYCTARFVRGNRIIIDRVIPANTNNSPPYRFFAKRATVEVMARKPVNINTASKQVLVAVFSGLAISGADIVSTSEAEVITDRIYARIYQDFEPFTSPEEFASFIRDNFADWNSSYEIDLTSNDITSIILNANRNFDVRLRRPTMPFTYRSYDNYKIKYSVLINNAAKRIDAETGQPVPGLPRAKYSAEEIRQIGTEGLIMDGKRLVGKFRQQEYASYLYARDILFAGSGLRISSHTTGATDIHGNTATYIKASLPYSPDKKGNNILDFPGLGRHFDNGKPYLLNARPLGTNLAQGKLGLNTGSLHFWFKMDQYNNNEKTIIMDIAAEQYRNRLVLFYEPRRRALVMRILASDLEAAACDYVFPLRRMGNAGGGIRSDVWYHTMLTWKGSSFRDILQGRRIKVQFNLLLDGLGASPVVRIPGYFTHTYYPDGWDGDVIRERYSYLTRNLNAPSGNQYDENVHQIVLEDASGFPTSGVIQINDEVIRYSRRNPANRNILEGLDVIDQIDPNTGQTISYPNGIIRGARGSTAAMHETGSAVYLWGYSLTLLQDSLAPNLPAAKGRLISKFGRLTGPVRIFNEDTENTDYDDYLNEGPLAGLPEGGMKIIAQPSTFDDFPEQGYVLVWGDVIIEYQEDEQTGQMTAVLANPGNLGEIIFYDGIHTESDDNGMEYQYLNVGERNAIAWKGQPSGAAGFGTDANGNNLGYHFVNNSNVRLISIELDDVTNYHANGGYVFLDERNEICRYTEPVVDKHPGSYLLYNRDANNWRGQFSTQIRNFKNTNSPRALPLFMINSVERRATYGAGAFDKVTVVQSTSFNPQNLMADGDALRVLWTNTSAGNNRQWIVLSDFVDNLYTPGGGTRLIKFPSCELPLNLPDQIQFGHPTVKDSDEVGFGGYVDEIQWFSSGAGDFFLVNGINDTDRTIRVNNPQGLNWNVGIIKVDDELIAYARRVNDNRVGSPLLNCTRGFLGTIPKPHGRNAKYINIANITCARMNTNHSFATATRLNITSNDPNSLGNEGYLVGGSNPLNLEVFKYLRMNNRYYFSIYTPENRGLYRGMFGSPPWDFLTHDVLVKLPYRYEDKFKTMDPINTNNNNTQVNEIDRRFINTPEQKSIGGAHGEPGARWLRVHWAIVDDPKLRRREGNFMRIHMYIKPSNIVSWSDPAVKHFIFRHNRYIPATGNREDPDIVESINTLQQMDNINITADGIEWRVSFEFVNNAFLQDCWKWSPEFVGCYFEYEQDGKVHYFRAKGE